MPTPSPGPRPRAAATVGLLLAAALPTALLAWLGPATVAAARAPGADASALVAAAALGVAGLVTVRLLVTAGSVLLTRLPGAVGTAAGSVAQVASPALLKATVRVAVGAGVAAAPILGGVASATPAPAPRPAAAAAPVSSGADPGWPHLDRLATVPAAAGTPSAVTSPGTSAPQPVPAARPHAPRSGAGHVVVVRPGDSLWAIAARSLPPLHSDSDVAGSWPRWYAANRALVGPDPGRLVPGQHLVPPTA